VRHVALWYCERPEDTEPRPMRGCVRYECDLVYGSDSPLEDMVMMLDMRDAEAEGKPPPSPLPHDWDSNSTGGPVRDWVVVQVESRPGNRAPAGRSGGIRTLTSNTLSDLSLQLVGVPLLKILSRWANHDVDPVDGLEYHTEHAVNALA